MPGADQLLVDLAAAVLDGATPDWEAAEASAGDDVRALIRHLRTVASVVSVHRDCGLDESVTTEAATSFSAPAGEYWGHLRLLEPVGRGAFGQVFRAWDTRLDREVALKLLPATPPSDGKPVSAIIREGRLLAKVRHPNVVTIYGAEQIGDRIGLWMEFVRGDTLDQVLQKGTVFKPAEVIAIGIELCRAVSAVHAAGLLHRDIKAHNVTRADDGRIVLMDLGAGRELADGSSADVAGTPLYLAPEVLQSKPATVQSDLYSVGVLLFHLATGAYPVRARSIRELREMHARGQRVEIRDAQPGVPLSLARVIAQAIDPLPERRPRSARALGDRLVQLQHRARWQPALRAAAILAGLVAIGLPMWFMGAPRSPATTPVTSTSPPSTSGPASLSDKPAGDASIPAGPPAESSTGPAATPTPPAAVADARANRPVGVRPSVQVLPIANAAGRVTDAWLSAALAEMLLREFRASEAFRWIPGSVQLARAQLGEALWIRGSGNIENLLEIDSGLTIRPIVPADIVVSGDYRMLARPDALSVFLRIEQRTGGGTTTTIDETGETRDLVDLVSRLGARARSAVGADALTPAQAAARVASQPSNAQAARFFAEGLSKPSRDAVDSMQQAVDADPTFAPAHIALAEAFWVRTQYQQASAAARRALQHVTTLPREERILIEIRSALVTATGASVANAIRTRNEKFRQLADLFPDTLIYRRNVAAALNVGTQHEDALAIVDRILQLPDAKEDVDLLFLEAAAARGVGDAARAQRALASVDSIATRIADDALIGAVRYEQATLARDRGEQDRALSFAESALQHFVASARRRQAAKVASAIAGVSRRLGSFAAVQRTYDSMIANAIARGDRTSAGILRFSLADLLSDHGELASARTLWEQLARTWEADSLPPEYGPLASLGLARVLTRQGELFAADKSLQSGLADARSRVDRDQSTAAFHRLAELALDLGNPAAARDYADRAVRAASTRELRLAALTVLSRVQLEQGDTDAATRAQTDATANALLMTGFRLDDVPFDFGMLRARSALDLGQPAECRTSAQQVIERARRDLRRDDETRAETLIALSWLAEGNLAEARNVMSRVEPRLASTEDRLLRLTGGIAAARVRGASNTAVDLGTARQTLDALIVDAGRLSAVAIALDARLALGELEIAAGDVAAGRARLSQLAADAARMGYVSLGKKAAVSAKAPK